MKIHISDCVTLGTQLSCHGLVGRESKCCKENILSRWWFHCGGERQTKWSMTRMDSLSARNKLYKPPSWHWLYPACSSFVKPFIILWNRDSQRQRLWLSVLDPQVWCQLWSHPNPGAQPRSWFSRIARSMTLLRDFSKLHLMKTMSHFSKN